MSQPVEPSTKDAEMTSKHRQKMHSAAAPPHGFLLPEFADPKLFWMSPIRLPWDKCEHFEWFPCSSKFGQTLEEQSSQTSVRTNTSILLVNPSSEAEATFTLGNLFCDLLLPQVLLKV